MRPARRPDPPHSRSARTGATLTEILMAILIMAVGIVSVFTLFPLSVLRTIQATQRTNAKILQRNVSEIVKTSPVLLTALEAGAVVNAPLGASFGAVNYRGPWAPQTVYAVGDVVVPTLKQGNAIPFPLVLYRATNAGVSGTTEPVWSARSIASETNIDWQPLNVQGSAAAPGAPLNYVVDPLGWNIASIDGSMPRDEFGNKTDPTTSIGVTPLTGGPPLLRIHGSLRTLQLAEDNVYLDDSWEEVYSGTPSSVTFTSVTFAPGTDLGGLSAPIRRVVLTSTDGTKTIYRRMDNISGQTVNLYPTEPIPNLPSSFPQDGGGNPDVGLARIEILNRRFSWFLTVRNSGPAPEIKCAVVFSRNPSSASEHVYDANFGNEDIDLDGDGTADGTQHLLTGRTDWVKIMWDPAVEPAPLLKAGNWLFDARASAWYQVQQIHDLNDTTSPYYAVLILDQSVRDVTPDDNSGPPDNASPPGRAMLMPGVVQVFDL